MSNVLYLTALRELSEQIGRIAHERELLQLGRIAVIDWDLDLPEFVALLERAGLTVSAVGDVQVIGRAPAPGAA